ncbi:MAG TPA: hypothetical protein VF484_07840 [Candidatus Limnocylindrales bacterium]
MDKRPLPPEGFTRPGPGEHDIPEMGPDVEGHGLLDQARVGIEGATPGNPGADDLFGLPSTGGEYKDDLGPDSI